MLPGYIFVSFQKGKPFPFEARWDVHNSEDITVRGKMMDSKAINPVVLEPLVNLIVSEYSPEKIILFGSHGIQKAEKSSDIDLLIVKRTSKRFVDRVVEVVRLIRSRFGFAYPVEPLIYTPDEWRDANKINSAFIRAVVSNGVVLYEKE